MSDRWTSGTAYEAYMGRWSRLLAPLFVKWLRPQPSMDWLDVGCGTGALTSAVCRLGQPRSVVACDPAEPFVKHARERLADVRVSFLVASADALPGEHGPFDAIVSGLVLNFLPDPPRTLARLRDRLRPGGSIGAYVWDYATGVEFLRQFWQEAATANPDAGAHDEGRRFPLCQPDALASLFRSAGLTRVETTSLDITTVFTDFDDYWTPFSAGTGPAPSYVASLTPLHRDSLKESLRRRLRPDDDGHLRLPARAWAVRGWSP